MSPNRNIELKARYPDLAAAARVCLDMGAREAGLLIQTDTYFHIPPDRGRLKLREIEPDRAELIWYQRGNQIASRRSDYRVVPVPDPQLLKLTLQAALGVRGEIRKRRRLLLCNNVRIHLDDVADLGSFIEFEAVITAPGQEAAGHQQIDEWCRQLGITKSDRIAVSYSDLAGLES